MTEITNGCCEQIHYYDIVWASSSWPWIWGI